MFLKQDYHIQNGFVSCFHHKCCVPKTFLSNVVKSRYRPAHQCDSGCFDFMQYFRFQLLYPNIIICRFTIFFE